MMISELHVMSSNAGYYVGRTYYEEEFDCDLPYSRESGYFKKKENAEKELRIQQRMEATAE